MWKVRHYKDNMIVMSDACIDFNDIISTSIERERERERERVCLLLKNWFANPIILRQRISFSILVVDNVGMTCLRATFIEECPLTLAT